MAETKTEWYIIVNPRAGSGKTMSEWVPAELKLEKLGIPYVTEYTDHKRHATALAYEAATEGYRKIMVVGGDGSVHEMVTGIGRWCHDNAVNPEEFTVGVAPIGSGNDWIKTLKVPHEVNEVIGLMEDSNFGKMDLVELKFNEGKSVFMANGAGTGFDAHVCKRVNFQKERGLRSKSIYLNALLYTITHLKSINISVVADGECIFSGACLSVAMGNGRYSGSGMRQVPLAEIDDGIVDVMIVPKIGLAKIMKEIPRLFNGTAAESDTLVYKKCKCLSIMPLDDASADIIEADGEIVGTLPLSIEMNGEKIGVIRR